MVIDNFNNLRSCRILRPYEADALLLVDTDGVLAFSVSPERFEPVGIQDGQILQTSRGVEYAQAPFSLVAEGVPAGDAGTVGKALRVPLLWENGVLNEMTWGASARDWLMQRYDLSLQD